MVMRLRDGQRPTCEPCTRDTGSHWRALAGTGGHGRLDAEHTRALATRCRAQAITCGHRHWQVITGSFDGRRGTGRAATGQCLAKLAAEWRLLGFVLGLADQSKIPGLSLLLDDG